jgi:hypothetical protein
VGTFPKPGGRSTGLSCAPHRMRAGHDHDRHPALQPGLSPVRCSRGKDVPPVPNGHLRGDRLDNLPVAGRPDGTHRFRRDLCGRASFSLSRVGSASTATTVPWVAAPAPLRCAVLVTSPTWPCAPSGSAGWGVGCATERSGREGGQVPLQALSYRSLAPGPRRFSGAERQISGGQRAHGRRLVRAAVAVLR